MPNSVIFVCFATVSPQRRASLWRCLCHCFAASISVPQQFGKIANSLRGSEPASPKSPTAECCPLIDASVAGAAAGAAAFLTAPLDKVKLR